MNEETGEDASGIDFLLFSDLEQSVRDDVERIKSSPLFPRGISVWGFIYEVRTERLSPVATWTTGA